MTPNSTSNLNPNFNPLITNFTFPSPLLLYTHHQDLLLHHHHFPIPTTTVHETLIVSAPPSNPKPPPPQQKWRHSKIHTSQGLRDRRVRLSIGISRQFFDLQDMLGFDKASKTLDWLLSSSKNAISELARSKHQSDCHVATTGQTDSIIGSNGDHAVNNNNNTENQQGSVSNKKKKAITRARMMKKKTIFCGNPTAMNQSDIDTASTSITSSAQKNNNDCFPNLALDWDDLYNPVLPLSSFVVSNMD